MFYRHYQVELVRAATYQAVDQMMAGENVTMLARCVIHHFYNRF